MNLINKQITPWYHYLLMFGLIAMTGFDFFFWQKTYLVLFAILSAGIFLFKNAKWDKVIFIYVLVVAVSQFIQFMEFSFYDFGPGLSIFLRIFFAYFVIRVIGTRFIELFIKIIYFFSLISLVFFTLGVIFPGFPIYMVNSFSKLIDSSILTADIAPNESKNIIIFNFHGLDFITPRNSGPFWEPGVFSIFLNLAIFLNLFVSKNILLNRYSVILIIALLTTFSTGGYLGLFAIFIIYYSIMNENRILQFFLLPTVIIAIIISFAEIDFLSNKIDEQIDNRDVVNTRSKSMIHANRFGIALRDLNDFIQYPFIGRGRFYTTRFSEQIDKYNSNTFHRSNGITDLLVVYGLPVFLLYFYQIFKTFKSLNYYRIKNSMFIAVSGTILILIISFSEILLERPFFIAFCMLWSAYEIENKNNYKNAPVRIS